MFKKLPRICRVKDLLFNTLSDFLNFIFDMDHSSKPATSATSASNRSAFSSTHSPSFSANDSVENLTISSWASTEDPTSVMLPDSPTPTQRGLVVLVVIIILASLVACLLFQRVLQRCNTHRTIFNGLLLLRSYILQLNLVTELVIMVAVLDPWSELTSLLCVVCNALTGFLAFSITYLTSWLSLVRLLLLAVARWMPQHSWRVTNTRVYLLIGLLYVFCAGLFMLLLQPTVLFFVCAGLPIETRPSPNTTALGILFLISTLANTLLLYADATLPPALPRRRNVLSARRFALFTLCEQLLVLLWAPVTALTAGITRALLTRVLMISQAGLLDTLGLALLSPQMRAALLGRRWRVTTPRRPKKVAAQPVPIIRLELI